MTPSHLIIVEVALLEVFADNIVSILAHSIPAKSLPAFPHTGGKRVNKLRYAPPASEDEPGRVWINRDQCFEGVATTTWEFTIGGYRPAEKWLKDRKNRVLLYNDITHYRRICAALAATCQVMQRIDQAIDSHGGWPLQ